MNIILAFLSVSLQTCLAAQFSRIAKAPKTNDDMISSKNTKEFITLTTGENSKAVLAFQNFQLNGDLSKSFVFHCQNEDYIELLERETWKHSQTVFPGDLLIVGSEEDYSECRKNLLINYPRTKSVEGIEAWIEKMNFKANVFGMFVEDVKRRQNFDTKKYTTNESADDKDTNSEDVDDKEKSTSSEASSVGERSKDDDKPCMSWKRICNNAKGTKNNSAVGPTVEPLPREKAQSQSEDDVEITGVGYSEPRNIRQNPIVKERVIINLDD